MAIIAERSAIHVVFRADASIDVGSGHVMRCLVLADELVRRGATCTFICREHPGHLGALIRERGHALHLLPFSASDIGHHIHGTAHASWLGADQLNDAKETLRVLDDPAVDRLVVDHYGIDQAWERIVRPKVARICVIDDIADRHHEADLLLDQNLGDKEGAYRRLVPDRCITLFGPRYALLAPAFKALRSESIAQRRSRPMRNVLITMGGVDKDNVTSWVLRELAESRTTEGLHVTVVMGRTAPWVEDVRTLARTLPWSVEVLVDVKNMASLMAEADLAVGAAGSTSWERCCLGLPSVLMVLAENQRPIAEALASAGAVRVVDHAHPQAGRTFRATMELLLTDEALRQEMASASAAITDGEGAVRVCDELIGAPHHG